MEARAIPQSRVIATIDDPVVVRKILTHLRLPTEVPAPRPPQAIYSPADLSQLQRASSTPGAGVPAREVGRSRRTAAARNHAAPVGCWCLAGGPRQPIVRCVVTEGQQADRPRS